MRENNMMTTSLKQKAVKFIGDAGLTLIANCISMITLQIIIFPGIGNHMTDDDFGNMIFWYTVFNFAASVTGSALSNLRLRNQGQIYRRSYQFVMMLSLLVSTAGIAVFYLIYTQETEGLLYVMLLVLLMGMRNYYIVAFRLDLKFNKVLLNSILQAIGAFIGFYLYLQGCQWYYVLLLGEVFSLVYIFAATSLWKERIATENLSATIREYGVFLLITLSSQLILYADRFVLKFILGNSLLTSYYIATNGTKILSICASASSSVVLSYLSKMNKNGINEAKKFFLGIGSAFFIASIFINYLCSEAYVWILYRNYMDEVQPYIWSISLVSAVNMLITMIKPFTIRFVTQKNLMKMEVGCMSIQVMLTILGAAGFGIFGVILARGISFIANAVWIVCLLKKEMGERSISEYENHV